MSRVSLASRIAWLAATAVGLAITVGSIAAYVTVRDQMHSNVDKSLLSRAEAASGSAVIFLRKEDIPPEVFGTADIHMYLLRYDGTIEAPGRVIIMPSVTQKELQIAATGESVSLRTVMYEGEQYRLVTVPAEERHALMLAQSVEPNERTLDRLGLVLFWVGALGMAGAGVSGLLVARSALRPVRELSTAAQRIARTDRLEPIPVTGDDELASLATSFNEMLTALSASRHRQRQLIADAGHELRTPLTSVRTNLELLAQADREGGMTADQRAEIFDDVNAQLEELSVLVGDLVELAREEPLRRTPEPIDLADLTTRAVERVRRRAPGVTFDVQTSPWWVIGEPQILERAVTNLLDNAAKWSPTNGTVTVRLHGGELSVADDGPGIKAEDLPKIFDRFYRAEDARRLPGSGLGLAIVKQAAERHGGQVSAGNLPRGGSIFVMRLPGGVAAAASLGNV